MNKLLAEINNEWTGNLTNDTFKYFFYSYGDVVGLGVFFTFLFGVIGVAMFIHSNHNKSITLGYFLIVQIFMVALFPSIFTIVVLVFVSLIAAGAAFATYYKKQ